MSEIRYAEGTTYLVIKGKKTWSSWELMGFHTRKTKPDVARDEVAIKLDLKLPAALFEKPTLGAQIKVDGEVPSIDLSPETVETIENVIRSTAGLDVELKIVEPD
jgi:hypothetical protein